MTGEPHLLNVYSRWHALTGAKLRQLTLTLTRLLAAVGQIVRAAARLLSLTLKTGEGTTLPTRSPTALRILLGRTGAGVHVLKVGVRL